MKIRLLLLVLLLVACGRDKDDDDDHDHSDPNTDLKNQMLQLQAELEAISKTDYANCDGVLSDAAKNICAIAQAATIEERIAWRGAISDMAAQLESRIDDSATNFTQMAAAWKQIYGSEFPSTASPGVPTESECSTNTGNSSVLGCIAIHSTDIVAIQGVIAVLSGTVAGAMTSVEVGSENIAAGPNYEQLLRLGDKFRINAYTDGLGPVFAVGSNPLTASNGSAVVTVTITGHGMSNGDRVRMEGCTSGRGFTWQHLNGTFEIAGAAANTFTITLSGTAGSNGTFGAATCIVRKFSGAGVSTIWTSAAASDSAIRTTTGGSKSYNFIIKKGLTGAGSASEGYVCYDTTNRSAVFSTINAATAVGTTGNIKCK